MPINHVFISLTKIIPDLLTVGTLPCPQEIMPCPYLPEVYLSVLWQCQSQLQRFILTSAEAALYTYLPHFTSALFQVFQQKSLVLIV